MNVDLFHDDPSWKYYVYASLIVVFAIFFVYVLMRSRRRLGRLSPFLILKLLGRLAKRLAQYADDQGNKDTEWQAGIGLTVQQMGSDQKVSTILQWTASSGRTNVIRELLQVDSKGAKKSLSSFASVQALFVAIKNGHQEAAAFLMEAGDGLEYVDEHAATLLHCAAKAGQSDLISKLID